LGHNLQFVPHEIRELAKVFNQDPVYAVTRRHC